MKIVPLPWDRALVIHDVADPESYFTDDELRIVQSFHKKKRRDEWLLSRIALKQLPQRAYFSLSHSAPYAGAATDDKPVGIDVQVVRDVDERAAHLFLSNDETRALQRCSIDHRLLHFWCAKEAAWKQRSSEFATMRQLPLALLEERDAGLLFDAVETIRVGDLIVALSR